MPRIKGVTIHISRELLEKLAGGQVIGGRTYYNKTIRVDHYTDTDGLARILNTRVRVQKRPGSGNIWDVIGQKPA